MMSTSRNVILARDANHMASIGYDDGRVPEHVAVSLIALQN